MKTGDYVELKEAIGPGNWQWTKRYGHITDIDKYCCTVRADDGESVRDVREHFRSERP